MECKINDDLESVDKNYRQQLEKLTKVLCIFQQDALIQKKRKKKSRISVAAWWR